MRSSFPGYFRPTAPDFDALWRSALIAVDANVLLNLYRYSQTARTALLDALGSVRPRLFVPHQAAKEFLDNRLNVTASQADEYTKTIRVISDLVQNWSNAKRHPFLPESELPEFRRQAEKVCQLLASQRDQLLQRLTEDETLEALDKMCSDALGAPLTSEELRALEAEGLLRYQNKIPPGYRDAKKEGGADTQKRFGDLIVWKQVVRRAKDAGKPVILVTDDQKDDWWLEQSGRTVGPRPELVEEFLRETGQRFWMYPVDQFLEHLSKSASVTVSRDVLDEVIEQRERIKEEAEVEEAFAEDLSAETPDVQSPPTRRRRSTPVRQPNQAFMAPLDVSPELARIVGPGPLPRTEIVSKLWAYIKARQLQDGQNSRMINCDDALAEVFGRRRVSMFEMAGIIGKHVRPLRG